MKSYDLIILGGGPAGYTAALYGARAGLSTLILEKMSVGGQMALTGIIENYPGFPEGVDGFTLGMSMEEGARRAGAVTEYAEVTAVDFSGAEKKIETTGGTFFGKTVIVATGASPRPLGLSGEAELTGRGVHYCAHCDGRFYKDKTVVVVGGGNSAAGDALYLSRLAKKVILVHRRDTLRATRIYHQPLKRSSNVEFHWNSMVSDILTDGRVVGVRLTDVETGTNTDIPCDGVFVSIGREPATEFLKDVLDLDPHGYIIAGEDTKTALPGVFAAGDVRQKPLRQVVTATADGAVAATLAEEYLSEQGI